MRTVPRRYPFSAALCRGLIEAGSCGVAGEEVAGGFPRLYAAASLKHVEIGHEGRHDSTRFPRLYAAASLKQEAARVAGRVAHRFSAALCRGLIEASEASPIGMALSGVFRGFMPRPH